MSSLAYNTYYMEISQTSTHRLTHKLIKLSFNIFQLHWYPTIKDNSHFQNFSSVLQILSDKIDSIKVKFMYIGKILFHE